MTAKYYKEYNHNYLVLGCDLDQISSFQQKMITRQKIPNLFSCSIRHMNGQAYYYYEITSKVSVQNLFQHKMWDAQSLKQIFSDLQKAMKGLADYLLDTEKIMLSPEYIFYDFIENAYFFLFYPGKKSAPNVYEELLDFVLMNMDSQDQELVDCLYQVYEEAEHGTLIPARVISLLSKEKNETDAENVIDSFVVGSSESQDMLLPLPILTDEVVAEQVVEEERENRKRPILAAVLLGILSLLGVAGTSFAYFYLVLNDGEQIAVLASMVACMVLFGMSVIMMIKGNKKGEDSEQFHRPLSVYTDIEEKILKPLSDGEGVTNFWEPQPAYMVAEAPVQYGVSDNKLVANVSEQTVYFEEKRALRDYKLFSTEKENKNHISFTKLPLTVGKMSGCVDICLSNPSLSRIHAEIFEKNGNQIWVKDLNSTNGTFVNGIRLMPNEEMEITLGDEIRFGQLSYVLR